MQSEKQTPVASSRTVDTEHLRLTHYERRFSGREPLGKEPLVPRLTAPKWGPQAPVLGSTAPI
jgi:hypothetical protein